MSNELVLIETRIKEGDAALDAADKHAGKVVEFKVAAGLIYEQAAVMCVAIGLVFKTECKRVTSRSYSQVCKVRQIAKAPDPEAEQERQNRSQDARNAARSHSNETKLEEWVGLPRAKEPPAPLPLEEQPDVMDAKAAVFPLTPEKWAHVRDWKDAIR